MVAEGKFVGEKIVPSWILIIASVGDNSAPTLLGMK